MSYVLYVHLLINVITYNYRAGMINIRFFKKPKSVFFFFFTGATTHCEFVFCSPLAGYSLLAYEVS